MAPAYVHNNKTLNWLVIVTLVAGLYLSSLKSYLLFHSLVELFSIIIASSVFIITWNSVRYITNPYLLTVGISYLFVGMLDLLHTLAYKGMPIFTDYDYYANQLWIAARYMESITLFAAFALLLTDKKVKVVSLLAFFGIVTSVLIASIFYWKVFPVCFVPGKGLTDFKIYSEYIICTILSMSIILLFKNKHCFTDKIYKLVALSIIFTIISELSFTFYIDNYGFSNLVGHYFKLFSFMVIYRAILNTAIEDPYSLIFNELNLTNKALSTEIAVRNTLETERENFIHSLQHALEEIKVLKGILPICMHCKKIRDDSGYWNQIEIYIRDHSNADFSHGICPECMKTHYPTYCKAEPTHDSQK